MGDRMALYEELRRGSSVHDRIGEKQRCREDGGLCAVAAAG